MKSRLVFVLLAAMLTSVLGTASTQGTPEPMDHSGHMSATPTASNNMSMGAFYFTVKNTGSEPDRLVKIESDIAMAVEIHNVEMKDGVMAMSPQHDGVEIPAGGELVLEPGAYHVMLIGINKSLIDGEEFTAKLTFEKAGEVEVVVPIFMAEPGEDEFADPVKVGDNIEVSKIWARQAPKVETIASPMASPEATPGN